MKVWNQNARSAWTLAGCAKTIRTGDFQNPDWPELYAEYASAFAIRFDCVSFFTPVNEILINASFSAQQGWWNERLKSDTAFVTALKHMCKANIRAEEEITRHCPQAP
jgi:beta-glucosidase/6-phospho-beta-glucosidase/beta-galactosidase